MIVIHAWWFWMFCGYEQGLPSLGRCNHTWLRSSLSLQGHPRTVCSKWGWLQSDVHWARDCYTLELEAKRAHLASAYIDHCLDISDEIVSNGILISMQEFIWNILHVPHATRIRRNARNDKLHYIKTVEQYIILTRTAIGRTITTVCFNLTKQPRQPPEHHNLGNQTLLENPSNQWINHLNSVLKIQPKHYLQMYLLLHLMLSGNFSQRAVEESSSLTWVSRWPLGIEAGHLFIPFTKCPWITPPRSAEVPNILYSHIRTPTSHSTMGWPASQVAG